MAPSTRTCEEKPAIRLGGKKYKKGIAAWISHVPSYARYDLSGGNWKRFKAVIGIEVGDLDAVHKKETGVTFVVNGDGKELYRSSVFRWNSPPGEADLDIAGVKDLELRVVRERYRNAARSCNWADARLEK